MAFDIATVLKGVSDLGTEEQIVKIPLEQIDPDPENFYSLDKIDDLAGNIELVGLLDPIRVRPAGERYVVVSGHRRRAACLMIRDGGSKQFENGVPCIIEYGEASDAMRKLRLIYANSSTRQLTSAEQSRQAEEVTRLLYELKEQGVEFPGRMRDHVAEACQLSKTKIGRLQTIRRNCQEYILNAFDEGKINESVAYEFSRLPKALQKRIYVNHLHLMYKLDAITGESVQQLGTLYNKLLRTSCKKNPNCWCATAETRFDYAQKLTHFTGVRANCIKGRCCIGCPDITTCEYCCVKCGDERSKAINDQIQAQKSREAEAALTEKARENARKRHDAECAEIWSRIRKAADENGKCLEGIFDELCECDADVQQALRFCSGAEKDVNRLAMDLMDDCLVDLADMLDCSVDFLLGRSAEVKTTPSPLSWTIPAVTDLQNIPTEPRWFHGTPSRIGRYFCRVKGNADDENEPPKEFRFDWDGEVWYFAGSPIMKGLNVLDWWPLPDMEEPASVGN